MDADLSLDKAKKANRQSEAVHEQQGILKHTKEDLSTVNFVGKQKNHQRGIRQPPRAAPSSQRPKVRASQSSDRMSKCTRCNKGPHMSALPSQGGYTAKYCLCIRICSVYGPDV